MFTTYAFLELFAASIMLVLFVAGLSAKIKLNRALLLLIMVFSLCLVSHSLCFTFLQSEENLTAFKVCWIFYMFFLTSCLVLFHHYIISFLKDKLGKKRYLFLYSEAIGIAINVLWLVSLFNGFIYKIENNAIEYTNMHIIIELLFALSMFIDILFIIRFRKYFNTRNSISLIIYACIPLIGNIISKYLGSYVITMLLITLSILLNYCISHMETTSFLLKKEKEVIEKDIELADKQHKLVYSQIQPHFLYNVLNTIYYLVDEDKEKGKRALVSFSDYMRMNLDSINKPMLIGFADELKKTEIYLTLEKLRFEDELEIKYDIETKAFDIPQLTLQPIIENAVKHGICKKKGGGTVTIYTREFDECFEVGVVDDGVGFDITQKKKDDSRSHVGLENITYRVNHLCGGTVNISSEIGVGTKVIIKLPKEKN